MIVTPKDAHETQAMASFIQYYAGVAWSSDMQMIGWLENNVLVMAVALNGFMGKLCQIHVAMKDEWHFTPKKMLKEVFKYAYATAKRDMLVGIVNSKNQKALDYDRHLGFEELFRIPKMHDDGGDVVVLGMTKDQCRYLHIKDEPESTIVVEAGHA